MINPNYLLLEHTLKSSFNVVVTLVNRYGEEHEQTFKKHRKDFLRENVTSSFRVCLVDDYPPREMESNIYYVKRSGKTVWIKMREQDFEENF